MISKSGMVNVGAYVNYRILLVVITIGLSNIASASDSYLCIVDQAAGFDFNEKTKKWSGTAFRADNKYLVKKSNSEKYKWGVTIFGGKFPSSFCKTGFDKGFLVCKGFMNFSLSKNNLRFIAIHSIGYNDYDNDDPMWREGTSEPHMEIGKCSPL